MRLLILLFFICPSVFAAYTTMTIEGVKQSNGVWTAAGVMDSSGFVRTTGAVSVMGRTRNLPVAMAVDTVAASAILKSTSRLLGPIALAASAYEVYEWVTSTPQIDVSGNEWVSDYIDTGAQAKILKYKIDSWGGSACPTVACSLDAGLKSLNSFDVYKPVVVTSVSKPTRNSIGDYIVNIGCTSKSSPACSLTATYLSNPYSMTDPASRFNSLPNPSNSVLANGFNNIPSLKGSPIPITGVNFTPFSEWFSDPYYQDGNWYRDRMDVSPCPTSSQPTRVCVDIGPQKFEGQTDPHTVPSSATGTATGTTPKEQTDFCKKNPQSIACQELGELEEEELTPVEKPFQITPQNPWGSGDSQCPAPKVMHLTTGSTVTLSYQPACDFFRGVRPAVLALAFLTALYIALGIPVGKGD